MVRLWLVALFVLCRRALFDWSWTRAEVDWLFSYATVVVVTRHGAKVHTKEIHTLQLKKIVQLHEKWCKIIYSPRECVSHSSNRSWLWYIVVCFELISAYKQKPISDRATVSVCVCIDKRKISSAQRSVSHFRRKEKRIRRNISDYLIVTKVVRS